MNGSLVMLRCGVDDFPVALLPGEKDALDWLAHHNNPAAVAELLARSNDLFNLDATEVICWAVVSFDDGDPVGVLIRGLNP